MKSCYVKGVLYALGVCCLASGVRAQEREYGSASLLPLPQASYRYPLTHAATFTAVNPRTQATVQTETDPLPVPPPPSLVRPNDQPNPSYGHRYEQGMSAPWGDAHQHGAPVGDGSMPGGYGCGPGGNGYGTADDGYGASGYNCGAGADGFGYGVPGLGYRSGWFASAGGLVMTRDHGNHYYFSYDSGNEAVQLLDSREADMSWGGGVDIRFGRYFNCGQCAVEAVYWGVYPSREEAAIYGANMVGSLDGILNWDQLSINGNALGGPGSWVDNADVHRIRRDYEFHNVELNLLNYPGCFAFNACGQPRFRYNWIAGVRFFRFEEDLEFAAKEAGAGTTFVGDNTEVQYNIGVENNLVGFQLGGQGECFLTDRLSLIAGTKLGLYGNRINHSSVIYNVDGVAVVNNGPNAGRQFNVRSNKSDVAFLGEANVGLNYRLTSCWSAGIGYRAVAVTGVALSTNQIPGDLRGIDDLTLIDSNGSLILHGGFANVTYNY